jgi:hypothetical protein
MSERAMSKTDVEKGDAAIEILLARRAMALWRAARRGLPHPWTR